MDQVIGLAIAAVVISLLVGQVLKGGLGLLRIVIIAFVFVIVVLLSARPRNSPGLLPSLAQRIWSENSVRIAAEASGDVLTDDEIITDDQTSSGGVGDSRPFSTQTDLSASSTVRSPEAAFSGATTTANSNDIEGQTSDSTVSPQSPSGQSTFPQSTPLDTTPSNTTPPSTAASEVQSPSSTRPVPPSSTSRPINALW